MFSSSAIFGIVPFVPKRILVLPCEGGEIMLFVVDGKMPVFEGAWGSNNWTAGAVFFEGWGGAFGPHFRNSGFKVPEDKVVDRDCEVSKIEIEVVFRLVPKQGRGGQTAEIVAISLDGCASFYANELSTLLQEYANPEEVAV